MSEPTPIIEKVYAYIEGNGLCSRSQIAKALGIGGGTASDCLNRLRELGEIKGSHSGVVNSPVLWEVGSEEGFAEVERKFGAPIRTIISTWAPHMRRDPLVEMLFGKAA